jgi:hypothetical protein
MKSFFKQSQKRGKQVVSKEKNEGFTIIPAPAGTKGIFSSNDDHGDTLEIEDVVFLIVWHEGVEEGRGCPITPDGCSMFGVPAKGIIHPDGRVVTSDAIYKNIADFMRENGRGRGSRYVPLINAATDEPIQWDV